MRMSKMVGRSAAILSAMAIVGSTAAVSVSAAGVTVPVAAVAAAEYTWNVRSVSPDQYVKVGDSYTLTVEVGSWVKSPSYQWQYCSYGKSMSESSWSNISGATSATLTGKMTSESSGGHFRCVVKDSSRNVTDVSPVRTIWAVEAAAKLGTASKVTSGNLSGYYKVPVTISGLYKNSIGTFCPEFIADSGAVSDMKWSYSSNLSTNGDVIGGLLDFSQENKPVDTDGDGKTDRVDKVAGAWMLNHTTVFTPTVLGSDNTLGYLFVKLNSGVSSAKITMKQRGENKAALYGDNFEGDLIYGMSYSGTTVGGSSSSSGKAPTIKNIEYNTKYHQFKVTWEALPNAQAYAVAYYAAGKWRQYGSVLSASTLSWTSPKLTPGKTFQMCVGAKIDGKFDGNAAAKKAFTVTVK